MRSRARDEHRLARARQLGDKRERIPDMLGNFRDAKQSGNEQAVELEARIAGVDAEL